MDWSPNELMEKEKKKYFEEKVLPDLKKTIWQIEAEILGTEFEIKWLKKRLEEIRKKPIAVRGSGDIGRALNEKGREEANLREAIENAEKELKKKEVLRKKMEEFYKFLEEKIKEM